MTPWSVCFIKGYRGPLYLLCSQFLLNSNLNIKCPALFNLLAIVYPLSYEARAGRLSFYYNGCKVSVASVTRIILAGQGSAALCSSAAGWQLGVVGTDAPQALPSTSQLLLPSLRSPLQNRG